MSLNKYYLISGDEILLVEEQVARLLKKAREEGYDERIIIEAEMPDAVDTFLSHRQNYSLFSTKKIMDIRCKQKMPLPLQQALIGACEKPDPNQILLVRMPKLSRAEMQSKWCKAFEKNGEIITLWPLKNDGLLNWIQKRFQSLNISTSREGYALIAENTEGNLLAAAQIIEKLQIMHDNSEPIAYQKIQEAISNHTHYDVFELCDAALNQNPAQCLKILSALKNQDSEPAIILWALMQDTRKLAALSSTNPQERASLYPKYGIWSTRQALFQKSLKTFNAQILSQLIHIAKQADEIIKGAKTGDIWNTLEDFCVLLSKPVLSTTI